MAHRGPATIAFIVVCAVLLSNALASWGPDKSKQLSGYITVPGFRKDNGTHLFYWFFESRNSPSTAPFVLWLTGGPGCSSLLALFVENGPYSIVNGSVVINPYSWNEAANIMWLDQPVGTGFSYADHQDDYATDETQIAEDLWQFLQRFFKQNPQYNNRVFVFGESYAGHYVPAVGARIVAGNAKGRGIKINLEGLGVGNGWVDPAIQYGSYADILHQAGLLDIVSTTAYDDTAYPVCKLLINEANWFPAIETCSLAMEAVLADAEAQNGRTINVYNYLERCEVEPLCYDFSPVTKLLNQASVKKALDAKGTWVDCAMQPHLELLGDWVGNYAVDLPAVLAANIPVLIYSGTDDWICNYLGGEAWANAMSWPGQQGFNSAQWQDWNDPNTGSQIGSTKTYNGFTFLAVFGAGHMVPMDQPNNALLMLETFLNGHPFGSQK